MPIWFRQFEEEKEVVIGVSVAVYSTNFESLVV